MKCLKEPLSRLANRQDKTSGTFFESRFKSVAILDEEALLAISVYIDLNPVAAKVAETPETSDYTSHQFNNDSSMSRLKVRPPNWKRPRTAVPLARKRLPIWKSLCGSVRSKTAAGWIRTVKA